MEFEVDLDSLHVYICSLLDSLHRMVIGDFEDARLGRARGRATPPKRRGNFRRGFTPFTCQQPPYQPYPAVHEQHPPTALCMQRAARPLSREFFTSPTPRFARPLATHPLTHAPAFPFIPPTPLFAPRPYSSQIDFRPFKPFATMSLSQTSPVSMDELAATLKKVGLDAVPQEPNTHPTINPFDIYRAHIAELLGTVTGLEAKNILPTLQWTTKAENGDLQLAVPALRVKGKDLKEFAKGIAEKVRFSGPIQLLDLNYLEEVEMERLGVA